MPVRKYDSYNIIHQLTDSYQCTYFIQRPFHSTDLSMALLSIDDFILPIFATIALHGWLARHR